MILLLTVLALTGSALSQIHDDPCLVPATATPQFRNDFASCGAYFWCDGTRSIPTGPCREGFDFDELQQGCVAEDPIAPCAECPTEGLMAVSILNLSESNF